MKHALWLLCILFCIKAAAQKERTPLTYTTTISYSPLALLNTDNTIQFGVEHRFKSRWAFSADAGYIFSSYYLGAESKNAKGFTVRPAIRYYLNKNLRFYAQSQLVYKQANYRMYDWLGKNCVNEVPAYDKLQKFVYRKHIYGINMMMGQIIPLSENMNLDFYFGLGFRKKQHQLVDQPNSCYERFEGIIGTGGEDMWLPSLPVGIKLAYTLK